MARTEAPDLVFSDIKMPGLDGLEVLTRLKAQDESLPVVMISGHGTVATAVEATKLGAMDFIEKPLSTERVLLTVRNAHQREPPRAGEPAAARRRGRALQHRRAEPGAAAGARCDRPRRADQRHRARARREWRRQGTRRARHPPQQPPIARAVRAGQLRRHPRGADRERAVRAREGQLHGRHRQADRQVRAGRSRHDLPRRSRRHEPEDAGQGAARAAGGRGRAHRLAAHAEGGRARHRRHQQGPRGGHRRGHVSRGPRTSASA